MQSNCPKSLIVLLGNKIMRDERPPSYLRYIALHRRSCIYYLIIIPKKEYSFHCREAATPLRGVKDGIFITSSGKHKLSIAVV